MAHLYRAILQECQLPPEISYRHGKTCLVQGRVGGKANQNTGHTVWPYPGEIGTSEDYIHIHTTRGESQAGPIMKCDCK